MNAMHSQLSLLLLPALVLCGRAMDELTVTVPGLGALHGVYSNRTTGVAGFLGIPYVKAPVGKLRWREPQPPESWDSVRDASRFGNVCPGVPVDALRSLGLPNYVETSEDCIFLNVFAPTATLQNASAGLPVLVWIHGGGGYYTQDSRGMCAADALVERAVEPVIVVTINYRLGMLGFLGSAALARLESDGSTGNYGLDDQRAALQWVKGHISAFGGNGGAVTIAGQSAGGNSVLMHLAQPASKGLYKKAISESQCCTKHGVCFFEDGPKRVHPSDTPRPYRKRRVSPVKLFFVKILGFQ